MSHSGLVVKSDLFEYDLFFYWTDVRRDYFVKSIVYALSAVMALVLKVHQGKVLVSWISIPTE